ncbi:phage protein [Niallia circulans]|uniref:Phage protein n=1 Tax=Niallia circulans TaxID=1397 RepID=A0A0J1IMN4_NIACI|nr:Rho termination factor N-terminal domain-containing protein [Niallia circulans]KLV27237.1 phage protein [Niallia circulans]
MIVKTRKTISGTEYWDAKNKKVLVVPNGQEPPFEVTENTKSMILGVDIAKGRDKTIIDEVVVNQPDINLDKMKVEQLLEYAKENNIEVPGNMKKEDTIRKHIEEALKANDGE